MHSKLITLSAVSVLCGLSLSPLSAKATTVDDVAELARQYGYSESMITNGYNIYYSNPDKYTEADFNKAIGELQKAEGIMLTTGPQTVQENTVATETAQPDASTETEQNAKTVSDESGNTVDRISEQDFIDLPYQEKLDYISSFTPEQQQIIINNLTPDEYKSIMKQLPVEQKAEVADSLAKAGEAMGMKVTVDEITDDNISVSMRDDEGNIVGIANAGEGALTEDTGYDRRGIFAVAFSAIAVSVSLIAVTVKKCFKKGEENE